MAERGGARALASTPGSPAPSRSPHGRASTPPTIAGDGRPLGLRRGPGLPGRARGRRRSPSARWIPGRFASSPARSAGCRRALPDAGRALVHEAGPLACFDLANATSRTWHQGHDATVVDVAWTPDGALSHPRRRRRGEGCGRSRRPRCVGRWRRASPTRRRARVHPTGAASTRWARRRALWRGTFRPAWRRHGPRACATRTRASPSPTDDGRLLLVSSARRGDRIVDITAGVRVVGAAERPTAAARSCTTGRRSGGRPPSSTRRRSRCSGASGCPTAQTGTGGIVRASRCAAGSATPSTGARSRPDHAGGGGLLTGADRARQGHRDRPPRRPRRARETARPSLGPVAHATPTAYVSREGEALVVRSMVDGVARARPTRGVGGRSRGSRRTARGFAVAWADGAVEAFDVRGG